METAARTPVSVGPESMMMLLVQSILIAQVFFAARAYKLGGRSKIFVIFITPML
jgi:hypothetical protein